MPRSRSGSRAAAPRRPRTVSSPAAIIGRDRASLLVLARATVLTEGFDPDAGERGAVIRASAVGGIYRDAPAALPPFLALHAALGAALTEASASAPPARAAAPRPPPPTKAPAPACEEAGLPLPTKAPLLKPPWASPPPPPPRRARISRLRRSFSDPTVPTTTGAGPSGAARSSRPPAAGERTTAPAAAASPSYSLDALRRRAPPPGVNPSALETYLTDAAFREVFRMDRAAWADLAGWRRTRLKREAGLF